MQPSLTLLIPTYARTAVLQEALWSALNQTVQVPIVVLNDCPQQIIECPHPLVRVVNLPERLPSPGAKRNALLDLAESEWVAWLDDEDLLLPWYVEDLVTAMGQGGDTVLAQRCWFAVDGGSDGPLTWKTGNQTMAAAVRTETARSVNGFIIDGDGGEDLQFVKKIISQSRSCSLLARSGYCNRRDNGVYHQSGIGEVSSPGERFLNDADQRLLSGREPSGRVIVYPSFRHDYFQNCPDARLAMVVVAPQPDIDPIIRKIEALPGLVLRIIYPRRVADILDTVLGEYQEATHPAGIMSISVDFQRATGRYTLSTGDDSRKEGVPQGELGQEIISFMNRSLQGCSAGLILDGGAVVNGNDSMLLLGGAGTGKTFLIAWLLCRAFRFLADGQVLLEQDQADVSGVRHPLRIRKSGVDAFSRSFPHLDYAATAQAGTHCDLLPQRCVSMQPCASGTFAASLMVFVEYRRGTELSFDTLSAAQAALLLMGCVRNGKTLPGGGFAHVSKTCKTVPALRLVYGDFAQLDGTLDRLSSILCGLKLAQADAYRLLSPINRGNFLANFVTSRKDQLNAPTVKEVPPAVPAATAVAMPEATPRGPGKFLTIGMATYDDYDGVFFTVQAIRLYHPEILADIEILVVDNHPQGPCAASLKRLDSDIPGYRYVPESSRTGTAVRDLIFAEASGEFVLCMDCHVLIVPGALYRLVQYCRDNSQSRDLLQGPLVYNNLATISTHFQPVWRAGMYGVWGTDERGVDTDAEPFDIPMQGLGVFCCRKSVWPGFNPRFRGFGGEEGYLHEKFRQNGGRTLCLPFLRWLHRFDRPLGVPYKNIWEDRIFNYFVGFSELGVDVAPIKAHFVEHLGKDVAKGIVERIQTEMSSPLFYFDGIFLLVAEKLKEKGATCQKNLKNLDLSRREIRWPYQFEEDNEQRDVAIAHRNIIAMAKSRGWQNVLILSPEITIADLLGDDFTRRVEKLRNSSWSITFFSGKKWLWPFMQNMAIAYHCSFFDTFLAKFPESSEEMAEWQKSNVGLYHYLRSKPELACSSSDPGDQRLVESSVFTTMTANSEKPGRTYLYDFSICAMFYNESVLLKEWLDHHLLFGCQHFYLINNASTDDSEAILQPYLDKGLVDLVTEPRKHRQHFAYDEFFLEKIVKDTEWIAVIDLDEFLYPRDGSWDIREVLTKSPNIDAFAVPWLLFGSSGHLKQPKSIVGDFLYRQHYRLSGLTSFKTVARTDALVVSSVTQHDSWDQYILGIHSHRLKGGRIITPSFPRKDVRILGAASPYYYSFSELDIIQASLVINHYRVLSKEYFINIKSAKPGACSVLYDDKGMKYFFENDKNEVFDDKLKEITGNHPRRLINTVLV